MADSASDRSKDGHSDSLYHWAVTEETTCDYSKPIVRQRVHDNHVVMSNRVVRPSAPDKLPQFPKQRDIQRELG
eukprot:2697258-Amphidinium_carterae.1